MQETFICRWLSWRPMEFLGPLPLVICLDYVCDTGVIELQTLAIHGHFLSPGI